MRSSRGSATATPRRASRRSTGWRCAATRARSSPRWRCSRAGEQGGSLWTRHALQEAAIRLAALSGDARFAPHLPALDDGWRGTTLERELARALERCAG